MKELSSDDMAWIQIRIDESVFTLKEICQLIGEVGGRLYGIERMVKTNRTKRSGGVPAKIRRLLGYFGI